MKKLITILTFIFLTALFSCVGGHKDSNNFKKQETPKALQDNNLEIKSYSRSGSDLTEELYQELVDKTPALKKLEDELDAFSRKPNELDEKYNKFDNKSSSYYLSANNKASAITDSLLRKKMVTLIAGSQNLYSKKTAEHNSLLKQISQNGATLNDHHSVLKIVLTLPIIEKFQNDNLPDKKEFIDLIKRQQELIEQIISLTPKY